MSMKPFASRANEPRSHWLLGEAPAMMKMCLTSRVCVCPVAFSLQLTCCRNSSPVRLVNSVLHNGTICELRECVGQGSLTSLWKVVPTGSA